MEAGGGLPRTPVLALTAFARDEDKRKALDAGFDDHLAKPLNANALISAIRALHPGGAGR
jgi:CheY-like chemotaxis protein